MGREVGARTLHTVSYDRLSRVTALKNEEAQVAGKHGCFLSFLMSKVPANHPQFSACHLPVSLSPRILLFTFDNVHYQIEKFTSKFTLNSIR